LEDIQKEQSGTTPILTGPLKTLLSLAYIERIDDIHGFTLQDAKIVSHDDRLSTCSKEVEMDTILLSPEEIQYLYDQDDFVLIEILLGEKNRLYKTYALEEMWKRKGSDFAFSMEHENVTLARVAQNIYESATVCHEWNLVRRIADLTEKYDDRIEDVLLDIVIRHKRLAVGRAYSGKATFSKPYESVDIVKKIMEFCGNNTAESVLTQEIILHLGYMIRNEPELFENMIEHCKAPKLLVYLETSVEAAMAKINKRGREYEKVVEREYWEKLNSNYRTYFDQYNISPILKINVDGLDFENNEKDREYVLGLIDEALGKV